jgi:predicted nucleic acid-binding protein
VGEIEMRRACRRANPPPPAEAVNAVLTPVTTISLDEHIAGVAAGLDPPALRSLDAIHLASALALGDALDGLVTYDSRLAEAAAGLGMAVLAPR